MNASAKRTIRLGLTVGLSLGAIVGIVGCAEQMDDVEGNNAAVESDNGFNLNGFNINGFNTNGFTMNGFGSNGFTLNGSTTNGFTLNGFWPFGSGCEHSDWLFLGAVVENDKGEVMRGQEVVAFARRQGFKIISVADLIAYRQSRERLVEQQATFEVSTPIGKARGIAYATPYDSVQHLALIYGDISSGREVPVRLHRDVTATVKVVVTREA